MVKISCDGNEIKRIVAGLGMCVEQGYHEQWDETMKKDFDVLIAVYQGLQDELAHHDAMVEKEESAKSLVL